MGVSFGLTWFGVLASQGGAGEIWTHEEVGSLFI